MRLRDAVAAVRESGDFGPLEALIPYNRFMGITAALVDGEVTGRMKYSDHLVGNASVPALHGGTLGALMESTAIFMLLAPYCRVRPRPYRNFRVTIHRQLREIRSFILDPPL